MALRNSKKRVLVADDDQDLLSVTKSVLEFAGFKVDTAVNGEDALKRIKKRTYDLLILDMIMPKLDGVKLFQMLKKSKKYASIPVLFISGYPDRIELDGQLKEIGEKADGYITKPIKTRDFIEKVKSLVGKQ